MPASYLLAKHIPDLHRFEPRNVGVIIWTSGGEVAARFLAEKQGQPGVVDGRSIPGFVAAPVAYRQWIKFWRSHLDADAPKHPLTGRPIDRTDPEFVKSLVAASKDHFVLAEAGEVLDEVNEDTIGALADGLFASLVEDQVTDDPRDPTLNDLCESFIAAANLNPDTNFKRRFGVTCHVGGVDVQYKFSYAYKNGTVKRLYQQVSLPQQKAAIQKNSSASAWMFEQVVKSQIIPNKDAVTALIHVPQEQLADLEVSRAMGVLRDVGRVLNVADGDAARLEFESLPALAGH